MKKLREIIENQIAKNEQHPMYNNNTSPSIQADAGFVLHKNAIGAEISTLKNVLRWMDEIETQPVG